jgi:hypothetical protein
MDRVMSDVMSERRTQARTKSFLQGRLYFNHRRSSVDCVIRDLTANGARLKFSGAVATPDIVELHIPSKDETFRAHIIWRVGDELGLCFGNVEKAETDRAVGEKADLAGRVQTLEAEVIALRRLFAELRGDVKRLRHTGGD